MNIEEIREFLDLMQEIKSVLGPKQEKPMFHPMLGKRCIIRTYSAGVHVGDVVWINPDNSMEVKLENAIRLWEWKDGGLSLSAIVNNGMEGGRVNHTGEVFLTNAIEYLPTTEKFENSFQPFLEDIEN